MPLVQAGDDKEDKKKGAKEEAANPLEKLKKDLIDKIS